MSASLVGSEMCIRDSFSGLTPSSLASGQVRQRLLEHITAAKAREDRAVSYTHLTLPTICSV
eukprot:1294421-Alexandrium_andersonii.AAC.1